MAAKPSVKSTCRNSQPASGWGAFGLTEPDHGSDPGSMVTRAEKIDGGLLAQRREDVDHQLSDC